MHHRLVVALSLVLASSLASAGADPAPNAPAQAVAAAPAPAPTTVSLVKEKLIKPLAAKDEGRSRFSRARLPPSERRVRILDGKPQQDESGKAYFTFAVDQRTGWSFDDSDSDSNWQKATITGCVYPDSGDVFIKRGTSFHPAIAATGKKTKAAPASTCHSVSVLSVRS